MQTHHQACSANALESSTKGVGLQAAFCVIHLIAGVVSALVAIGVLALFS